ncbi:MAG: spore cortex biosynthesis protein YabQ [Evtepia sp.]
MTVSVTAQAAALGLCLALGTGVGLFYDLLRRLRLSLPWQGLQGALDLLFWLGACGALFFCGIVLGDGHIRLYMALCLAAGAAVYFLRGAPWPAAGWMGPPGVWGGSAGSSGHRSGGCSTSSRLRL